MGMILTDEQQAILDGSRGETMAKVMKTLVMFGEAFHAEKMVPVTSRYNHLVTSFGLGVLQPVYDLMQQLIDAGAVSGQKFSADPRPLDPNVPANLLQQLVFKKFMYNKQDFYEGQLQKLGLMDKDAFTCTCYMPEVGNKPEKGEILSWSESSAVVYANSVLGARCNRNSGILDIMGSIVGYVPYFGLLTDEGRKATWIVKIETSKKPEAQLLGSAIGMKVMEDVPYVVGLDKWLGTELDDAACTYLKDFGAATASNGAVGLYHIANLTPEAKELGEAGRAPVCHRRSGAAAHPGRLSRRLEKPGRAAEALLHGLPAYVARAAEDLDRPRGGLPRRGRTQQGLHPHGLYRRSRRPEGI